MTDYRKPGVYVEERLLTNSTGATTASATTLFVGAAALGPITAPVLCNSWTDYVTTFGNFDDITTPTTAIATTFLPYAVYSYFQNGGRPCYVQRAIGASSGTASYFVVTDGDVGSSADAFTVQARSVGTEGDRLSIKIVDIDGAGSNKIFNLYVYKDEIEIERFQYLSAAGVESGTRKFVDAVNDPYSGSAYITIVSYDSAVIPAALAMTQLDGGVDPALPEEGDFLTVSKTAVEKIEGPIILNHVGYKTNILTDGEQTYTMPNTFTSSEFGRGDVFVINDSIRPKFSSETRAAYLTYAQGVLDDASQDSYVASYGPWIIVPNPKVSNATITIPPGGAIAGTISRIDSTVGVFRAPAGLIASIPTAVGVDIKFTDTELGNLNAANINIIRPVSGAGVCIMGARTRKEYGVDRYISARRTLIYIKESLRRSTQYAMFENNDSRLWNQLIATAERFLRPLWEQGGLRGASAREAFYIKCDSTINTPAIIANGEVRMEIGVALEYPAEFIVIRVSQYESGGFTAEVQSRA